MTAILALGWPVAAIAIWRWRKVYQRAWDAIEQTEKALALSDEWRERALRLEGELARARDAANDWEAAALVWHAVVLAPLAPITTYGRIQ